MMHGYYLYISLKKSKTGRFYRNTITIGELSQASRPLFNIVYCNNSLITLLDDIQLNMNRGNHESYGVFWVNQYNTYPAHALLWC
jgi:hypothetical protein